MGLSFHPLTLVPPPPPPRFLEASAPQNPDVTEIGVTTVRVVWRAPVNPNGIISGYRVRGSSQFVAEVLALRCMWHDTQCVSRIYVNLWGACGMIRSVSVESMSIFGVHVA